MKKIILMTAFLIGAAATGVQIRAHAKGSSPVMASPDLPPPTCFPDCPPEKTS